METKQFTKHIQDNFEKMCKTGKLFRSTLPGEHIWGLYITSFDKKDNPIFRDPNSSTFNCNLCKNFIRRYGNVVAIDENYEIITMFDNDDNKDLGKFSQTSSKISSALKNSIVKDVFFETYNELNSLPYEVCNKNNSVFKLGIDKNVKRYTKEEAEKFGKVKPNQIIEFDHLHMFLPKEFVNMTGHSIEKITSEYRDSKNVFQRTMEEIPIDTLRLVRDLINQGSLLDGKTHLFKVEKIIPLKKQYDLISKDKQNNWVWVNSYNFQFAKFKNELIGVLCSELAEGKDLNESCKAWNKRVDPINYMKTTAPITKSQIEDAKKFIQENGYEDSFNRRMATIDDIKASEILHINVGKGDIKNISIFDEIKPTSTKHKRSEFKDVQEVTIDNFMQNILPECTSVEVYLSNKHTGNMVSLTTSNIKDSKQIFKWDNNYSWTFDGNIAGKSQIKEAVKDAGGKVDGVMRFSLIWNDTDGRDRSDLDAWCVQPDKQQIGFSTPFRKDRGGSFSSSRGQLDLDKIDPQGKIAIENIYFESKSHLKEGFYRFFVNPYSNLNSQGFKAEIEIDGEMYSYQFDHPVKSSQDIALVTYKNGKFEIEHKLKVSNSKTVSKEVYNIETEKFHKVKLICLSPNHWGNNNVGNKHYLFMLDKCKCPNPIRSFHSENLIPELAQHRKVLEVLGNITMINPSEKHNNELSGLGFNATVKDELIVKVQGSFKRTIKIIF